jgi:hypothetical protein
MSGQRTSEIHPGSPPDDNAMGQRPAEAVTDVPRLFGEKAPEGPLSEEPEEERERGVDKRRSPSYRLPRQASLTTN